MDHQNQQHVSGNSEKKKRVTFWSPEEMITPQIIHSEPDLHANSNMIQPQQQQQQNSEIRNHHHSYSNYNNEAATVHTKYKSEPEYRQGNRSISSSNNSTETSSSPQKKPKKEIDSSKQFKCSQCEYSFNRRDHLTRHSLVHSKLKPFHCNFCAKDFTRNDHLRRHQQRVHSEEVAAASLTDISQRYVCQECKAIFTSSGHLRAHIENKHHNDFSEYITHTDDPLRKNSSQGTTYVIVDGKRRPLCPLCNKSFSKKDHLTRHMNSLHSSASAFESFTPEQSYNCTICGKRFSRAEFLRRHLDDAHSHASQMEILNHLNPNNSYNIQGNASVHENAPHNHGSMFIPPPPHMIQNSSFFAFENNPMSSTSSPSSVSAKLNKNTTVKDHKCTICNKNFSRKYHLTRHQKSLHGTSAFIENN